MTSTSPPIGTTCVFLLDDATLRYAQNRAVSVVPRKQRNTGAIIGGLLGGGLLGAVVGKLILGERAKATFFDELLTPPGQYELLVSEHGLALSNVANQRAVMKWTDIEAWGADDEIFIARDLRGNRLVLPRASIPEQIFSMIVEICSIAAKRAQCKVGKTTYGKWSQLGTAEKIVRGFIYLIGVVVLVLSVLIFVEFGLSS